MFDIHLQDVPMYSGVLKRTDQSVVKSEAFSTVTFIVHVHVLCRLASSGLPTKYPAIFTVLYINVIDNFIFNCDIFASSLQALL